MDPEREDALVRPAELPRPGEHPAPVHIHGQLEGGGVLERQHLRRELRCPVERQRRLGGELLGDPPRRQPRLLELTRSRNEGVAPDLHREPRQAPRRVHPAGAQHQQAALDALAELEQIDGAHQVVLDQLPAARLVPHAGQHARIRGRVDDPVHRRQRFQVTGIADVAVHEPDAPCPPTLPVQLAAGPAEVVEADEIEARSLPE